jgi:hypothetical protein
MFPKFKTFFSAFSLFYNNYNWIDQTRTDNFHYQKMAGCQITLQFRIYTLLFIKQDGATFNELIAL